MTNFFKFYIITVNLMCIYGHVLSQTKKENNEIFMNQFAVRIEGGNAAADRVASKHGFVNLGEIGSLQDYYLFEHSRIAKRSTSHCTDHQSMLESDPEVSWFQQQVELKRRKRDIFDDFRSFPLSSSSYLRSQFSPYLSTAYNFPDPLYTEQWYLHGGAAGGNDMNVVKAWQNGYTGRGVVVSILDDGIQTNHPDLILNYDRFASTDINGNDDDPMPQDNGDNKHGTRCAGEVAATAYNGICGVGVAYNASIGGVRMLDGTVNDAVEARALSHNPGHVDIYSASWGPEDDGKTVDGPGTLAKQAFIDGVTKGRQGKGSIFVWASGNGGRHEDNCNCDGYTNSIFTLSISSATQHGQKPWYLEECSSTLATTYSSGTPGQDQSVVTVDMALNGEQMCTKEHTGTSASAPIAAAICALALEANPNLTWRDLQYLVVLTSKSAPLEKDGWITNGVNRKVSHKFGYGLMDAGAMTELAERWRTVPPQNICEMPPDSMERIIPNDFGASVEFYLDTDGCYDTPSAVNYLEHVQAKISLNFSPRGNLRIILQSPFGTSSTLLFPRPRDMYKSTFDDWPFLSVHFWGERPAGRWRLTIINAGSKTVVQPGILKRWSLVFYGTESDPLRSNAVPTPMGLMPFAASSMSYTSILPKGGISRRNNQSRESYKLMPMNCHEECIGGCYGSGPDECEACQHLIMYSGPKKVCVRECSDGWYAVPSQECRRCHSSCQTCSGGSSGDCLTCQPSLLLLRDGDATRCTTQCPLGYFRAQSDRACNPCSSLCARCEGVPDRCTRCRDGLVLHNKTCMAACPRKTFSDGQGRCSFCHPSCATCIGPSSKDCVTCPFHLFHLNGTCIQNCPFGFYHLKRGNECYSCNPTCESCNEDNCTSCFKGWTLDNMGHCRPSADVLCPKGTYLDTVKCIPCHVSCHACVGPSFSQCSACLDQMLLYKNVCISECPKGFTPDKLGICIPCHETCAACDGLGEERCTACNEGLHFDGGHCITGCPDGYFNDSGQCLPCSSNCKVCKSSSNTSCTSCVNGTTLVAGSCLVECALGYFRSLDNCFPCHSACHTCKGDGLSDCLSCPQNYILDGGFCMECGRSLYYDPITEKCNSCNKSCSTCNGPDAFSCTSCVSPLKHDPLLHRCVQCCTRQLTSNCCHCDPHTDSCISTPNANKRRTEEDAMQIYVITNEHYHVSAFNHTVLVTVIGICLSIVSVFFIIFGILQARSNKYFCPNSSGYQPLPTRYNCEFDNVILEKYDLEDEEDPLTENT